jgi:hypothetical protein
MELEGLLEVFDILECYLLDGQRGAANKKNGIDRRMLSPKNRVGYSMLVPKTEARMGSSDK